MLKFDWTPARSRPSVVLQWLWYRGTTSGTPTQDHRSGPWVDTGESAEGLPVRQDRKCRDVTAAGPRARHLPGASLHTRQDVDHVRPVEGHDLRKECPAARPRGARTVGGRSALLSLSLADPLSGRRGLPEGRPRTLTTGHHPLSLRLSPSKSRLGPVLSLIAVSPSLNSPGDQPTRGVVSVERRWLWGCRLS